MTSTAPLKGIDLIDCARANVDEGQGTASQRCGYGADVEQFMQELRRACDQIGVELHTFSDLDADTKRGLRAGGVEIAPQTTGNL
ncbi:hypothetical protein [Anthocerotibacter panamensis]|uniref:hypothetical protein n=1 Tax=Anthocerotibacter panamensis TaxID=2857077 RepID=UPI001C4024FE|nr:hypothetical protein [Anthocerotibacter panamensis]